MFFFNKRSAIKYLQIFTEIFTNLKNVTYLNFSNNKITYLDFNIFNKNGKLERINAFNNDISTNISVNLDHFLFLKHCNLSSNKIECFSFIGSKKYLISLNLNHNFLKSFDFDLLGVLKELYIKGNKLNDNFNYKNLESLEKLNIENNNFSNEKLIEMKS